MSKTIFVTNRGNLPVTGRFENKEYVFHCGKEVEISIEIAKHIFGYGVDKKEPYFVRLGWMKMNTDLPIALQRMSEFVFSSEPNKPVHLSAPVVERVAAPMPEPKARGKGAAKVHAH